MKTTLFILGLAAMCLSCSRQTQGDAATTDFDLGWQFVLADSTLTTDSVELTRGLFPEQAARVRLPHTPRIEPLVVNDQWQGICWYARRFTPAGPSARRYVTFEAAMNVADVWVDGQHMLRHQGGYLPFRVDVTDATAPGRESVIVVRLDNRDNAETGPKPLHLLDFCTYGGLYRSVRYAEKQSVFITDAVADSANAGIEIVTRIEGEARAAVNVLVDVRNVAAEAASVSVTATVTDAAGNVVEQKVQDAIGAGARKRFSLGLDIDNARLWSPDEPNLYTLHVDVLADGQPSDSRTQRFGIRDIDIRPEGLWLNGRRTFLRGVNRHQEYPYVGYAAGDNAQWRDAYRIKQGGFDYVRCSHYPPSPAFLDACDELGIMVLDAILGWQYFGDSAFQAHALASSQQLIRRDRNHPCVLAWELSINETRMPQSFIEAAGRIVRAEQAGGYMAGWVRGGYDVYIEARQHRKGVDPSRPLIVSEYGDWEYYAQNAGFNQEGWADLMAEERNSRQPRGAGEKRLLRQATNVQEAHNDNLSTHAFADGYWVMFDYNRGYADDIEYSGLMDITRLPKPAWHFFRSQRDIGRGAFGEPMVHIASEWKPGVSRGVRVFSNCDEVELLLDGRSLGRRRPDTGSICRNLPHPPFTFDVDCTAPGKLTANGYHNGTLVASHDVISAGCPSALRLAVDVSGRKPERGVADLVFVYASIVDSLGTVVTSAQGSVSFECEGDAQIVGPATVPVEAGIAPLMVRLGSSPEPCRIRAVCDGMEAETKM